MNSALVRGLFSAAAEGFVTVVSAIRDDAWERPGLGEWTVRDLVGHTSRSLSTVEAYLGQPPGEITIHHPLDYLLALRSPALDQAAIAQRGRDAGAALGSDPAAAVRGLAERVTGLVASTPDEAPVRTLLGGATLVTYLPTRTFELSVHTLDVAGAVGVDPPAVLA
nr:maleylpyruvate isomerase N-terminal domain-containing protein [Actinomycetota bacterium]